MKKITTKEGIPTAQAETFDLEAFNKYADTLKEGERVIEAGRSGMFSKTGTIYLCKKGNQCIMWDKEEYESGQMGTGVTFGARRISDVIIEEIPDVELPEEVRADRYRFSKEQIDGCKELLEEKGHCLEYYEEVNRDLWHWEDELKKYRPKTFLAGGNVIAYMPDLIIELKKKD